MVQRDRGVSSVVMLMLVVVTLSGCGHRITATLVHSLHGHEGEVLSVAFSPDSSLLASGDATGMIKLWRVDNGSEVNTIKGHEGEVLFVGFSSDGTLIISGGSDQTLKGWRVTDGSLSWVFEYTGKMKAMLVASSKMLLATAESPPSVVTLWDALTGREIRTLKDPCWASDSSVLSMAFTPDGKWIAGSVVPKQLPLFSCVALWKTGDDFAKSLPLPSSLPFGLEIISSLAFSPQGRFLAAEALYSVILWRIEEGIIKDWPKFLAHTSIAYTLTFSPDETLLALCDLDGFVRIWKVPSGEEVSSFVADGCPLAFAPNGQLLASGSTKQEQENTKKTVKIWRLSR